MRALFFLLPAFLLMAGCFTRPPQQEESYAQQTARQQREDRDREIAREAAVAQGRTNYVTAHADLKPELQDAILNGRVVIGMTEEQAWKSLGSEGHDYHSVENANGRAEEWTFRDLHLVFANGILTEIVR